MSMNINALTLGAHSHIHNRHTCLCHSLVIDQVQDLCLVMHLSDREIHIMPFLGVALIFATVRYATIVQRQDGSG